jgi:CxxC motif-containing protein (DUF1111 family)
MKTSTTAALVLALAATLPAQIDPGPRQPQGGPPLSGPPIRGLSAAEMQAFGQGRQTFTEIDGVPKGLGPGFNLDSCSGCHAQPSIGGSSPGVNPQIGVSAKFGAINKLPSFIQADGPVRVVRFKAAADGTPDNGVHDLFVITGRTDAPASCQIAQPDFSNTDNLAYRIPTPLYGLGLIEALSDATLRNNLAATANRRQPLGIQGGFNTNGNDGTITRFGWKAQNKSLLMFSGEAYNVEMGVTNNLFPQEREETAACVTNALPEDHANLGTGAPPDIEAFSTFMRFLAPPGQAPPNGPGAGPSIDNGRALFDSVGCTLCHTPSMRTGNSSTAALSNQNVNLFSDLAIHHMGAGLADGITQGAAQGDQFRTAPLWGLGDRIFLLHDGRTQSLVQAIADHDSQDSEAHGVIAGYQALSVSQKQDLLNYLRSL